jgi:TFIIF-interacting CTD phosphatase-like protein
MPIMSWYDDPNDKELDKALAILHQMKDLKDVRPYLKKKFQFRQTLAELLTTGEAASENAPY